MKNSDEPKFRVLFLKEAALFLDSLTDKAREKVFYIVWKASIVDDRELFKKLKNDIWEFRILYNKQSYRFFAFWDKRDKEDTLVIATHGIVKKTDQIPKSEIDKADVIREDYFNNKEKA